MEAILGDFPSQDQRLKPTARKREDGSWLVDAMIEVDAFERLVPEFKLDPPGARDYQTFGGFVVKHLGHVPVEGESFALHGFNVEIIDMDRHRVDKVLLMPLKTSPASNPPAQPSSPAK
jgi:putative hemolysin